MIKSPPGDQSWWAVLETFALDSYDLRNGLFKHEAEPFFVDIGGNIGAFSLAFLEQYPNAKGISVEPGKLAYSFLEENLRENGADSSIQTINAAVVGEEGRETLRFFEKAVATGGSTTVEACTHEDSEPGVWVTVATVSIEKLLYSAGRKISLVKMDIEGGEYEIILNAKPEAWRDVERVVAEYHPVPGYSYEQLVEQMRRAGFELERHDKYRHNGFGALMFQRFGVVNGSGR